MIAKLKACYKHGNTEGVELTVKKRTVKYRGQIVEYEHHGHFCNICGIPYDEMPGQTDKNEASIEEAYLKLLERG